MIPKEIFKKVRQIEITTSRIVTDVFAGQYHSVFKGQGIEFDEVREYQFGDDIRSIDWNVTARTGRPYIKKYVEERELSVMILVDASSSCQFGTVNQLKSTMAAEVAAVLALAAIRNNDKVGLIIFTDNIELFIPPRKGLRHVLRVIREILYFKPRKQGTDIVLALDCLNKVTTHKTVSFLISDFLESQPSTMKRNAVINEPGFKRAMAVTNKRHDLIAITLNDQRETDLNESGLLVFEDAETGEEKWVDTTSASVRETFKRLSLNHQEGRKRLFDSIGVDHIDISTESPYVRALVKFFKTRRRRIAQ
jgi:uncharacterized protein (DUF58 family)